MLIHFAYSIMDFSRQCSPCEAAGFLLISLCHFKALIGRWDSTDWKQNTENTLVCVCVCGWVFGWVCERLVYNYTCGWTHWSADTHTHPNTHGRAISHARCACQLYGGACLWKEYLANKKSLLWSVAGSNGHGHSQNQLIFRFSSAMEIVIIRL